MRIHILGIGGTFMASVALLARDLGHEVSGTDANVYPPMSTLLAEQGIVLHEGYDPRHLQPVPDVVVVGNALSRGNVVVEHVLESGLPYISGAQWVAEHVLAKREVIAVAGTHGKTTTTSMLAWMLEQAGFAPGFLVGGIPENFGISARLGTGRPFVIEADEYDTAFFDKRSKFVHYRPRIAVLNNLEYDHADIFPDVEAIERQFHHLVRIVPGGGLLVVNAHDTHLTRVLEMGCWSQVTRFGEGMARAPRHEARPQWSAEPLDAACSAFRVLRDGVSLGEARWALVGRHNMLNALAALAAAERAGADPEKALAALGTFRNVKRRLEVRGVAREVTVYDDFAHHPTAIAVTLEALRARVGDARIIAVLEPRSNTMRLGVHRDALAPALALADRVLLYRPPELSWNLERVTRALAGKAPASVHATVDELINTLSTEARAGDHVLVMSNGGFGNIHARLLERLHAAPSSA